MNHVHKSLFANYGTSISNQTHSHCVGLIKHVLNWTGYSLQSQKYIVRRLQMQSQDNIIA